MAVVMTQRRAFWIGTAVSVVLLAGFAVLFVDVREVWRVMQTANYFYVLPALALYTISLLFRTTRWRFFLEPVAEGGLKRPLLPVVVVGYMALNLIPARIGEIVRAVYLSIRESISATGALGTVLLERLSDVLALLLLFAIAALVGSIAAESALSDLAASVPGGVATMAFVAVAPFVLLVALVAYIVLVNPARTEVMLNALLRFVGPVLRQRIVSAVVNLLNGFWSVRTPSGLMKLLLLSIPVWIFEIGMYYVIALGFDLRGAFSSELQFVSAIVIFGAAGNLGGVIPALPGNWGTMDVVGAGALIAIGADPEVAAAYALTVHVALWVPVTLVGAFILLSDHVSLARLTQDASRVIEPTRQSNDDAVHNTQESALK